MVNPVSRSVGLSALFSLNRNMMGLNTTMMRLATGHRINSGKDDPAGLIAAQRLSSEIVGLEAESMSFQRMSSNAHIAEGNLSLLSGLCTDINSLMVQGSNTACMSDAEQDAAQMQIDMTVDSIQGIIGSALSSLGGFNLPGNGNAEVTASLTNASASVMSLISGGVNSLASGNYEAAQTSMADAVGKVATVRGTIGAFQLNTLQTGLNSNNVALENLYAARSSILDTDYAAEASNLAMFKTLTKADFQVLNTSQKMSGWVLDLFH